MSARSSLCVGMCLALAFAAGCDSEPPSDDANGGANGASDSGAAPPLLDEEFPRGSLSMCLDGPDVSRLLETADPTDRYELEGVVVSDSAGGAMTGSLVSCGDGPSRILELQGDDLTPIRLGYTAIDRDDRDVTPALSLPPGESVQIRFSLPTQERDRSVAVTGSDGALWFAGGELLHAYADPSVQFGVRPGDPYGERLVSATAGCDLQERALIFDFGDAEGEAAAGEVVDIDLPDHTARGLNLHAWGDVEDGEPEGARCNDLTRSWLVWRLAP